MTAPRLAAHTVRKACEDLLRQVVQPGQRLVVGVSGGADSLALAAALGSLSEPKWPVTVVIVDHQLQPDSAAVAGQAQSACLALGLSDVRVVQVDVGDSNEGLEAAARAARLTALQSVAEATAAAAILLAHTADDQAETVLLRMTRGSGTRSLAGMRVVSPQGGRRRPLVRPLLPLPRELVRQSLEHYGLVAHEDPHNTDPRFLRARVRHEVLPNLVEVLGPSVVPSLIRTAELARMDADALDALAQNVLSLATSQEGLEIAAIKSEPLAIQTRVVRSWLLSAGVEGPALGFSQVMLVTRLAFDRSIDGPIALPGVEVVRESGRLRASRRSNGRETSLG